MEEVFYRNYHNNNGSRHRTSGRTACIVLEIPLFFMRLSQFVLTNSFHSCKCMAYWSCLEGIFMVIVMQKWQVVSVIGKCQES